MSERELAGRTAVVTGAGTGIGRGVALELARAGAAVVVIGRRAQTLEETAAAIGSEGGEALALAADLRRDAWPAELDAVAPEVDVLVHGAAAWAPRVPLEATTPEDTAAVVETSLVAGLALCRHVLPGMKARRFGRIVQVGSAAAELGAAGLASYASAKAGLGGLVRSLAAEAGRFGVTVNLLQLGWIDTPRIAAKLDPGLAAHLRERTAVGRPGTIDEVAAAVRFLVAPGAGFLTGATLALDGGLGLGIYPTPAPD